MSKGTSRLVTMCLLAGIIGILGGLAAEVLHRLIGLVTNVAFYQRFSTELVSVLDSPLGAGIIVIPAIGGLIIGLMARYGSTLVRGHGIPEAMEAILLKRSRIPPKVAVLKPISAAISIGSGQPFGAEGPVIQTGAALGSLLGQIFHVTAAERKVLLACGSAAGLAAVFGTPIAAVIFAIELLLFEFRKRSFIPLVIATTIATEMHNISVGAAPVFSVGAVQFGSPINLVLFLVLGIICGGVAYVLTYLLLKIEHGFHRLPINTYLWPALGGLFVGIVGYLIPKLTYANLDVFGPGYSVIDSVLAGKYVLGFLVVLLLAKSAVWLVALGSGTSGGVLAPVFMIGAAVGGIFGVVAKQLVPGMDAAPTAFALVGMAAVFGSSTRATFAAIVFAFEMTQNYQSILPVMFACVLADAVVSRLTSTSILTEQLGRSGILVKHDYETDPLETVPVSAVMVKDVVMVPQSMTVHELVEHINNREPQYTKHQALMIVDDKQSLMGIVTRGDLMQAINQGAENTPVIDVGTTDLVVTYPKQSVHDALMLMLQRNIGRLPVVDPNAPKQIVGYLSRASVMDAYTNRLREEQIVEPGWLRLPALTNVMRNGK